MKKHVHNLIALALGGGMLPSLSTLADAADDYQTVGANEVGYFDEGGNWQRYNTAGVGASGPLAVRLGPQAPQAPVRPAISPAILRPNMLIRPNIAPAPAPASGLTAQQIQQMIDQAFAAHGLGQPAAQQVQQMIQEAISSSMPYGTVPSRVAPDEALFPMGLGYFVLSGGPPAVLSGGFANVLPQRAFRGERLVLSTFRSNGASTVPVIVDTFKVGDYSQLVGGGAVPVETFRPDAFGVRLMLDGAVPGVTYTINCSVPVAVGIPAGETITVVGAVLGRTGEAQGR